MNLFISGLASYSATGPAEDARFQAAAVLFCLGGMLIAAAAFHCARAPHRRDR